MPFFSDFSRKNHCSLTPILSKKRPFSKKHPALMPIFCQKNVHPHKNTVLSCHFFLIFYVKPPCSHTHIWSEKRPFCRNNTILWAKKVNRMPFFRFFTKKSLLSCPYFVKKTSILKKSTLRSCPYFVKKTFILSKTQCSHVFFFQIFHEKPPAVMHIFGQKTSNLSKLYYIMGQTSQ